MLLNIITIFFISLLLIDISACKFDINQIVRIIDASRAEFNNQLGRIVSNIEACIVLIFETKGPKPFL